MNANAANMRINTNAKIIYPKLCYQLYGLFYQAHNELGRYCTEKQYADALELLFKKNHILYQRELELTINFSQGNIKRNKVDFLIDNKILVDIKAKKLITKEDYFQAKRYLAASDLKLLLIVNFRERYVEPKRVLNSMAKEG
ncbi:MAG: GxxExxY protein [Patescibacteria group bacterium]